MTTWLDFARGVLTQLGAPDTPNNEAALLTWMAAEQPPSSPNAPWNPLNIQAHGYPGEAGIAGSAGSGQFAFADFGTGVAQTADFLRQSNYTPIVASLQADAPAASTLAAIQSSPWAESHYGGQLVGQLSGVLGNWSQYANGSLAGDPSGGAGGAAQLTSAGGSLLSGLLNTGNPIVDAAGALFQPFFSSVTRAGVFLLGILGGVALLVLGAAQATAPARREVAAEAGPALALAGKAAAA